MSKVIAIAQHKGGVGKTVTTVNLGASLAELGKRVLVIDIDPQASLTQSFGNNPSELEHSIYNALAQTDLPLDAVMLDTTVADLKLIPSHINLSVAEMEFSGRVGRERILTKKLDPIRDSFDFILIDCPPTLSLLTINALAAADSVILPIQCELLTVYGLKYLIDTIKLVREEVNPNLEIEGYLLTMYDGRTRLGDEVVQNIRLTFGSDVFDTVIRRRIILAEAPASGKPITSYARASEGADDYRELAQELLRRG